MWYHLLGVCFSRFLSPAHFNPQTRHDGCTPPTFSTVRSAIFSGPPVVVHVPWSVERWVRCSESLQGLHNTCVYTRWRHFISTFTREVETFDFPLSTETWMCFQWTRWSWRLKPGAKQEIHTTVLVCCLWQAIHCCNIWIQLVWLVPAKKKKKNSSSSLPKFCITVKEMLFLRALHSSQYVIDYKNMRGWITVCIWSFRLMRLWSVNWLEWTTNVVICWHNSISGTFPDSCLPASCSALLSLTLNKPQC